MTSEHHDPAPAAKPPPTRGLAHRILTPRNFIVFGIVHSVAFTGLMLCAFVLGKPQPITFAFGFTHGVMYMIMTAACVVAARLKIVSITTALVVVIVGVFGPYFGVYEFMREERRRRAEVLAPDAG